MVELSGVVNFRDIGGHLNREQRRVRTGRVFRSGHLAGATASDMERLQTLGIRTVIDFRTTGDLAGDGGYRLPAGATRLHLPMGDPARASTDIRELLLSGDRERMKQHLADGQAAEMMANAAAALVTQRTREFGDMLRCLVRAGSLPAIVHCSAGKDRTGWAASLLLLLLDVPEDAILEHYAQSEHHRREENQRALGSMPAGVEPDWVRPFFECRPAYARASLDAMREGWGDARTYAAEGLGVSPAEQEKLREMLLE